MLPARLPAVEHAVVQVDDAARRGALARGDEVGVGVRELVEGDGEVAVDDVARLAVDVAGGGLAELLPGGQRVVGFGDVAGREREGEGAEGEEPARTRGTRGVRRGRIFI